MSHYHYYSCNDGCCGADDCPKCHPGNFRGGIHVDDLPLRHYVDQVPQRKTHSWVRAAVLAAFVAAGLLIGATMVICAHLNR